VSIPSDFCSVVEVDLIGDGGQNDAAQPGGGGAFANWLGGVTLVAGQSISIQVGSPTCFISCVTAKADFGTPGTGSGPGTGGLASNSIGVLTFSGGDGFALGGGGGAAGPFGNGAPGSANSGGQGDNGHGGVGGAGGGVGGNGTEWTLVGGAMVGAGGGGAKGLAGATTGTSGGAYGAGGGGVHFGCGCTSASGGGLIVFQYHPF
jgi:hypothetical protein